MKSSRFTMRMQVFIAVLPALCASLAAQPVLFERPLSPRNANYKIDVRLEPETRRLHASMLLLWRNDSPIEATELRFHLYLNAFRSSRTTFARESGFSRSPDGWGFIRVDGLRLASLQDLDQRFLTRSGFSPQNQAAALPLNRESGADVLAGFEFIQPNDGNPHDRSVARLPLPASLAPGEAIALEFDFVSQLPSPPWRVGAVEEFVFASQWFPKIGVLEAEGWNCHQFHASSEFFADFGVYDVAIAAPEDYVVGATGVEVAIDDGVDGARVHRYYAEDVHDFAWTASPRFLIFERQVQDVAVRALVQPDHSAQGQRHLDAAQVAIERFQGDYGDYPFPNLTIVDPRPGAEASGGMEYPTLITAGTLYGLPLGVRQLEAVIIHEFGHNYWYHLVASNEFEESWLDEGLTTYTEMRIMEQAYGPQGNAIDFLGFKISGRQIHRAIYMGLPDVDPVVKRAWEYYDADSYRVNSYSRPGLILKTLEGYLGPERMQDILRNYLARWRFRHPRSEDFVQVASETAGEDLHWFFQQALYSNSRLDYSISHLSNSPIRLEGIDFPESARNGSDDGPTLETIVKVRRLGEFRFPVEIEVAFDSGRVVKERWDGQDLWKTFRYEGSERALWARLDPEKRVALDLNRSNDSRTAKAQKLGPRKTSLRWMAYCQWLLDWLAW